MLPNSIGLLKELDHLDVSVCENLTTLPNSIGGLIGLKRMYMRGCSSLKEIPMELGRIRWVIVWRQEYCLMKRRWTREVEEVGHERKCPCGLWQTKTLTHLYVHDIEDVYVHAVKQFFRSVYNFTISLHGTGGEVIMHSPKFREAKVFAPNCRVLMHCRSAWST